MAGTLTIDTLKASSGVLATQNGMTGVAKAWVNFNGSTAVIRSSFNVSSITRSGSGQYTVNFTTAMPNADYAKNVSLSGEPGTSDAKAITTDILNTTRVTPTSSAFAFTTWNWSTSAGDSTYVYASVFSS